MAVLQRIKNSKSEQNSILKRYGLFAAYFAVGFVLSLGRVVGDVTPFGISITAASPKRYFPFAAAGALLGTVIGGVSPRSARYLAGISLALIGAFAAAAFELYHRPAFVMTVAFLANFTSGFILCLNLGGGFADYVTVVSEALLCGGATYFFYRTINAGYKRLRFRALPIADIGCVVISAGIVMMNLSSLSVWGICPARLAAMFLVLCAVQYSGDRRALILALSLGFSLSISDSGALFIVGALAFAALVALLFRGLSVFSSGGVFLCTAGFFAAASNSEIALPFFIEALIATAVFVLLPQGVSARIEQAFCIGENEAPDGSLRQNLVLKLRFASSAMAAISESVDAVRERINELARKKIDYDREALTEEEYIRREIVLEKTNQIRMVASDQFFSISDMLGDLALEFDDAEIFDTASAAKIRRLLGDYNIFPSNVSVIEDKFSRIRVEVLTDGDPESANNGRLTDEIGKILGRYFDMPRTTNFKNETMIAYTERPNYRLTVGFAQHSAEGRLCGDTVKVIHDGRGHTILIISDGMGKGSRAALDGAMGAGLISKLITAGFGFDTALKVVNCALLVKSNDESLATLDIISIDLYTGKCELYKAGAPASYIIKNGSITKCELTSMPAGILRGIEFAKRTAVIGCEDSVVLMSDGISDLGKEWVEGTLKALSGLGVQETADAVLTRALNEYEGKKHDDMSIIFAKLERN